MQGYSRLLAWHDIGSQCQGPHLSPSLSSALCWFLSQAGSLHRCQHGWQQIWAPDSAQTEKKTFLPNSRGLDLRSLCTWLKLATGSGTNQLLCPE